MDVLAINGKNYVKASVIARDLGYTADYVGQLCRAGKVDAKLFGRSWYVDKDSIGDHKSTRYRSTQAVSKKNLQLHVASLEKEEAGSSYAQSRFYGYSQQKPVARYTPDSAELMPAIRPVEKKEGVLPVKLADASAVTIHSEVEAYNFETPKLPEIRFKGSLNVGTYEEEHLEGEEKVEVKETVKASKTTSIHPKEVEVFTQEKIDKTAQNKVISAKKTSKENHNKPQVVHVEGEADEYHALLIEETTVATNPKFPFLTVFTSTVVSFAVAFLCLGFEAHIAFSRESMTTSYVFKIEKLTASVYSAFIDEKVLFEVE